MKFHGVAPAMLLNGGRSSTTVWQYPRDWTEAFVFDPGAHLALRQWFTESESGVDHISTGVRGAEQHHLHALPSSERPTHPTPHT